MKMIWKRSHTEKEKKNLQITFESNSFLELDMILWSLKAWEVSNNNWWLLKIQRLEKITNDLKIKWKWSKEIQKIQKDSKK